ncbi:hypothetical protein VP01_1292g9 [Puccinia sorghi]|uniref:Uncharacterized protein n=1 Tax=Puccinia sorghi TaxID=27349 RepID=A0A0L6VNE1_9BASI|nr:hypothetical protein VP01_1292g9 [Puccinia sorghi]
MVKVAQRGRGGTQKPASDHQDFNQAAFKVQFDDSGTDSEVEDLVLALIAIKKHRYVVKRF